MADVWQSGLSEAELETTTGLHYESIVIDCLGGSIIRRPPPVIDGRDIIDQRIGAGVTVSNETLVGDNGNFRHALHLLYQYWAVASVAPDRALIIETVDDIHRAKREGMHGLILGFQGGTPFEDDVELVYAFQKLGIRISGLAYNLRNLLGDGCYETEELGLTAFGRRIIMALNDAGITVDLSHVGRKTSLQAIAASSKPVIFSHSNVNAITPHRRNVDDEQIKAIAGVNGVIGIGPHSVLTEAKPGVRPTMTEFIDHIAYIAELVGIDHVGIGTDMFGGLTLGEQVFRHSFGRVAENFFAGYTIEEKFVSGFDDVRLFPRMTLALHERGFSHDDIRKVLGLNFLRVFTDTWR